MDFVATISIVVVEVVSVCDFHLVGVMEFMLYQTSVSAFAKLIWDNNKRTYTLRLFNDGFNKNFKTSSQILLFSYHYLRQGGYVSVGLRLFVCLSVCV